jgi:hypothetical protein
MQEAGKSGSDLMHYFQENLHLHSHEIRKEMNFTW